MTPEMFAFDEKFVDIGVQVTDMISCMALELGERECWAPVVLELVAAAQAYYDETGVVTKIHFRDNLRQYGKYWRGKSALGINADTERLAGMLEALSTAHHMATPSTLLWTQGVKCQQLSSPWVLGLPRSGGASICSA